MLSKIRNIAIGAALFLVAGLGTYLTTEVNWIEAFGPGIGGIVLAAVGYGTKEGIPKVIAYLESRKAAEGV